MSIILDHVNYIYDEDFILYGIDFLGRLNEVE